MTVQIRDLYQTCPHPQIAQIQTVAHIIEENDDEKKKLATDLQKFLQHQATNAFCERASKNVSQSGVECTTDMNELIVQIKFIYEPV